ncbi:unnamed protein product [Aspergillus oryzae]|uniref:Unnamed protein product n=1 Tax=Aspergillus oryzae TaxID=5062 RepID=A0AAN5BUZ5_ASPOZ|nr:unnamed protein product [Aspergillus oryzae]GMF91010.1 unnamed protein product [Aspergillus oryzae]GMG27612.1 unnamed protein product [Aspergillus oryzae]
MLISKQTYHCDDRSHTQQVSAQISHTPLKADTSNSTQQDDRTAALEERVRELEDAISSSFHSFRGALQQISSHIGLQDVTGTLVGFTARSTDDQAIRPDIQAESTPELSEVRYDGSDLVDKGILTLENCRKLFDLYVLITVGIRDLFTTDGAGILQLRS